MPIVTHPVFSEPAEADTLWRYMPFSKFISLLTTRGLWFSNLESFIREDPFEGLLPKGNYSHRLWNGVEDISSTELDAIRRTEYTNDPTSETLAFKIKKQQEYLDRGIRRAFAQRKSLFANCWHLSTYESAAMWGMYGQDRNSIAITTSINRLRASLRSQKQEIWCGRVKYIDYETERLEVHNGLIPVIHKRKSFEFENEVRLAFWDTEMITKKVLVTLPNGEILTTKMHIGLEEEEAISPPPGRLVICDLGDLIEAVKISPTADLWFEEAVTSVCEALGIKAPVAKSALLDEPGR